MRHRSALYAALLSFCFFFLVRTALADSCEANFQTTGSTPGNITYLVFIQVTNLDNHRAIAQVKGVGVAEGFQVRAETYPGDQGELILAPKGGGAPVVVVASSGAGRLAAGSQPYRGQPVTADGMRKTLCGLLEKSNAGTADNSQVPPLNGDRSAPPAENSRTAPPAGKQLNVLRPSSTFDLAAAKAALEPGTATIRGTACVRHIGNLVLGSNQPVYLFPATPYFQEWIELTHKAKAGRDQIDVAPGVAATRMSGMTNGKGQFQFANMKPGKYYLFTTISSNYAGTNDVSTGTAQTGANEITYYHELVPWSASTTDILDKYVDVKDGQVVEITLTSHIKWSKTLIPGNAGVGDGHAGPFGCHDGHGIW